MIPLPFDDRVDLVQSGLNHLIRRFISLYGKKAVIKALKYFLFNLEKRPEYDRIKEEDLQNL